MNRNVLDESVGAAVVTAVLAGVAGVAGSYALAGYTQAFLAAPITSFLTRVMPDFLLRFAIVTLTDVGRQFGIEHLGQRANLLLALVLGAGLLACLVFAALATGDRFDSRAASVALAGLGAWLAAAVVTSAPVASLGAGVGSAAVVAVAAGAAATDTADGTVSHGRRAMLGSLGSALGVGVLGYVFGSRSGSGAAAQPDSLGSLGNDSGGAGGAGGADAAAGNGTGNGSSGGSDAGDASSDDAKGGSADTGNTQSIQQLLSMAESKSLGVEGLEGLVSGDDFYEVDTANINPDVNVDDWSLSVTGAVANERTYDYDAVTSMARESRFMTLRCVSDPLNGKKMDNALWTGVPMERVLDGTNPQGKFVMARSTDGYYEEFPLEALETGFLAYGKDGDVLPQKHGYPVRALIPGHWGEINVKWLDEIEILDRPAKGFWEKKGWHGTGPANTVAKIHATNHRDDGRIQVGGHANAGIRGIRRVEVSTDGGSSWNEARLSAVLEPNLGGDVWRQWAYTYQPPNGQHDVVVRAVDGTGTVQPKKNSGPYPSGASGWVSKTVSQ